MKDIMNAPFLVEMVRTITNMYTHGWDERNGGNISWMRPRRRSTWMSMLSSGTSPPALRPPPWTASISSSLARANISKMCSMTPPAI